MTASDRPTPARLARLARLNPTVVFLATIAYVLIALFAPGVVGGFLLLALVVALLGLLRLTWSVQPARVRAGRLLILGLLLAAALVKIF